MTSKPGKRLKKVLLPKLYICQALEHCNNEFLESFEIHFSWNAVWDVVTFESLKKDANKNEIAIASDDGNILIYSANQINSTKPIVLKFKEEINAIITLGWGTAPNLDVIGIGSSESIQVYNAFENVSIFYKKIDDGLR